LVGFTGYVARGRHDRGERREMGGGKGEERNGKERRGD
jgi:hypothetical protein